MTNDIRVAVGFVAVLIIVCKMWNSYAMKQYEKAKENRLSLTHGFYVGNMEKPDIVGAGDDENGDYDVIQAIRKVELPDDIRIKINE